MLLSVPAGATSKIILVPIYDSSSSTGALLTGLAYNTASLTAYYNLEGASGAATAITLATATKGTWTSGGFVAVDGTNMPGWYELHVPNAALTGAKSVAIHLKGAANMVPVAILIELTATSNQDAVRGGMTALPNVASGSAGAVITSGTGTAQLSVSSGLVTLAGVTHTGAVIPTVTTTTTATNLTNLPSITAGWLTAAGIAASALNGKGDWNAGKTGYSLTATTGLGNQTANITGNLSGSVGSVTGATGSVTAGVTVTTNNDKTGYSLTATTGLGNQTSNITGSLSGSVGSVTGAVGSVTGAVGSVTGNVGGNIVGSVASVTSTVAITSNIKQNQALNGFTFLMTDSTNHNPATGLTVTVTRSIDGGAFAAGTLSAVTEVANGVYSVNFGSGDLNGKTIILQATAAASDTTFERIVTQV